MFIILTTTSGADEAAKLAEAMVAEKLAACVQVLPKMISIYFWEGKVQKDDEHLLLIKTLPEKFEAVVAFLGEHHSYDVPEIVGIETQRVSAEYRTWLEDYLKP